MQIRKARYERNEALSLARHYRNLAEKSHSAKRTLRSQTVRECWCNKVVEGGSGSGKH